MGKNKLGKFIAFTTTVTAIGGVCYIFRDKIKESVIFQTVTGKISDWLDKDGNPDDFIFDDDFDDEASFDGNAGNNRDYTSITITTTTSEEAAQEDTSPEDAIQEDSVSEDTPQEDTEQEATDNEPEHNESASFDDIVVNPSFSSVSSDAKEETTQTDVEGYEYEGLSDVSEDPDVLEDQDKLDF